MTWFKIVQQVLLYLIFYIQITLKAWWISLAEITQVQSADYLVFYINDHFN